MAGVMTRSTFPNGLREGIGLVLGPDAEVSREKLENWRSLFTMKTSKKAVEEIVQNYGTGLAQIVDEGEDTPLDEGGESWYKAYRMVKVGLRFEVTEEAVDDNLYLDIAASMARSVDNSMMAAKAIYATDVFNNAFNSAAYTVGDGKAFLATDHPLGRGGTFSNKLSGTRTDLSETALEDLRIAAYTMKNEEGRYANLMLTDLIVPVQLQSTADRLLNSPLQAFTADNTKNVNSGMFRRVVVLPYLTSTSAWFAKTDAPDGLIHWNRQGRRLRHYIKDENGNMGTTVSERYQFGVGNIRSLLGSEG